MNAEHVEDLIDLEAVGALEPAESAFVRAHAAGCPLCRASLAEAEATATRLALAVPLQRAPAALRQRVMREVVAPAPSERVRPFVAPAAPRQPTALMRFNRRWGAMAAMLFVVPLTGLLTWAFVLQNQVNDLRDEARQLQETQKDVLVLAVQPAVRARFTPTEAAGTARGSVTWNPDEGKCMVQVRGLPKEPGTSYHVFYQGMREPVDAGELRPDDEGTAGLIFDASRWRGDVYRVWVAAQRGNAEQPQILLEVALRRD